MASVTRMAIRNFSSSATLSQMVRPSVPVFGVDGRYASALFSAGSKQKQLEHIEKDMKLVGEVLQKNKQISETLKSPIVSKQEKRQLLQQLAKQHDLSPLTLNTFSAMTDNGRLGLLGKLLKTFERIMSAERGEVLVVVTTAKALGAEQEKELANTLQRFAKKGQTLKIEKHVDPSIIGGMVVSIGDRYVDMSTASKIKLYSKIIEETV